MNQLGEDGLITDNNNPGAPPLLIWVQLLVAFLLLSLISRSATLLSPSIESLPDRSRRSTLTLLPSHTPQVGGGITRRAGRGASEVSAVAAERVGTGIEEDEMIGLERSTSLSSTEEEVRRDTFHHPCNFVRLAGIAFVKCFGLDPK